MKKIIFSAVLVMAAAISFNSCVKKAVKQNPAIESANSASQEKVIQICPLSDITTNSYYDLGISLCGPYLNGQPGGTGSGTTGALDAKLNCNKIAGPGCNMVNPQSVYNFSYSSDPNEGTNILSDGVMTAAEQQNKINQIINACNAHKNANYGSAYTIAEYDCSFASLLCGGCPDAIAVSVSYKAVKVCKN